MFGRKSDYDEQSGILRSGKQYKRSFGAYSLGQDSGYSSLSQEESESEETPLFSNPPITPQRQTVIQGTSSQSDNFPPQSDPVTVQFPSVSSTPASPYPSSLPLPSFYSASASSGASVPPPPPPSSSSSL